MNASTCNHKASLTTSSCADRDRSAHAALNLDSGGHLRLSQLIPEACDGEWYLV